MNRSTGNVPRPRRRDGREPVPCSTCGRPTTEPRRGLCMGCRLRVLRGHVASGCCSVCGTTDARVLRRHRLADGLATLCANDAAIAGRRPLTVAELRAEVFPAGDRRQGDRRRADRRNFGDDRRQRFDAARLLDGDTRQGDRRVSARAS